MEIGCLVCYWCTIEVILCFSILFCLWMLCANVCCQPCIRATCLLGSSGCCCCIPKFLCELLPELRFYLQCERSKFQKCKPNSVTKVLAMEFVRSEAFVLVVRESKLPGEVDSPSLVAGNKTSHTRYDRRWRYPRSGRFGFTCLVKLLVRRNVNTLSYVINLLYINPSIVCRWHWPDLEVYMRIWFWKEYQFCSCYSEECHKNLVKFT